MERVISVNDIEVINEPTNDKDYTIDSCSLYCPSDCGCENAWNACFIGD